MKNVALICAVCLCALSAYAQSIQNLNAQFIDGKVVVVYDVAGAKQNQTYSLELFGSHNNYATPLQHVTGDVGKSIRAGVGKRITWDATAELGTYSGQITFKLKGELIPVPFSFQSPVSKTSTRRGKDFKIRWDGGTPNQTVHLDLYDGTGRIVSFGDVRNVGEYTWNVPKNFPKGTYSIQMAAGSQTLRSGAVSVKARVPMFLKILPILGAGGAVVALGGGSEGGGGSGGNDLPAAPGPR